MSEPTRHDFEQLAPPVDLDAAFAVFERRRRRRSTTRRLTFAGSIVVLVVAAVAAILAVREQPDQQVATEPEGAAAEIGACGPTLAGEPYSFSDLFELELAWVEADGIEAEPFPEYDEHVRDFYGRLGADQELLASVSYQRVDLVDPVVRRSGVADDVTYDGSRRVVAAHASTVKSVRPDDSVVAVISQSMAGATGDPQDVDFIETLAVVHPDGTVEFAGPCARQKYTEPLQRAAAAMSAKEGSGVDSESDTLNRMMDDPAFAEEAVAASAQEADGPFAWSSRPVRERSIDEPNVPAEVRDRLELVTFRFEMDPSLLSSPESLCFLTDEGWAGCTVLNATDFENGDDMPHELTPLTIPIPSGSWIETHLVDSPTYGPLAESTALARYEPNPGDDVGANSTGLVVSFSGRADDDGGIPPTVTATMRKDEG